MALTTESTRQWKKSEFMRLSVHQMCIMVMNAPYLSLTEQLERK
ncbi:MULTISPECIES: hypothetical protein [unclassified Shewanella]|jgi:hypothetical protein|nr:MULTISPECIES: hypothetical protein [unclassified Shewanella]